MAERRYRWGKFQGWSCVVLGVGQLLLQRSLLAALVAGVLLLWLGVGLLRKQRYGFVLVYVVAGLSLVGGAYELLVQGGGRLGAIIASVCFFAIPAVMYYPQRYREFGFGKQIEAPPAPPAEPVATGAVEAVRRELTDEEREMVLQHMRERRKPQEPTP